MKNKLKKLFKKLGWGVLALGAVGGVADNIIDPYAVDDQKYSIVISETEAIDLAKDSPDITIQKGITDWLLSYPLEATADRALLTDEIKWTDEIKAYPLKADLGMEDGGLTMEIVLEGAKPVSFDISGIEDLRWLYQDEENREDRSLPWPELAPEQQGSYAVYNSKGEKMFHVYRPEVTDAEGLVSYGKLDVAFRGQKKTLSIIPSEFVKYPVTIKLNVAMTSVPLTNEIYHD